jgi:hypothetical protein
MTPLLDMPGIATPQRQKKGIDWSRMSMSDPEVGLCSRRDHMGVAKSTLSGDHFSFMHDQYV